MLFKCPVALYDTFGIAQLQNVRRRARNVVTTIMFFAVMADHIHLHRHEIKEEKGKNQIR